MKHVLVTGASGFVGQHLVKNLIANGIGVTATGRHTDVDLGDLDYSYLSLDLSKSSEVNKIDFKEFDGVIHLAGLAAVGPSFDQPMQYIETNMGIEINLFETAQKQNAKPRFLITSSGSLYRPQQPMPLNEQSEVQPASPYAISKLGQEELSSYYSIRGFECIIARPFNHFGPGQGPGFIVPDLAEQVVNFSKAKTNEIKVGNLVAKRDYTDVRDIAEAYRLLLSKGKSGEIYNICYGRSKSGQQILDAILKETAVNPKIVVDKDKLRPTDADNIYGSYKKLNEATGWKPEISFEKTIKDVIDELRSRA